MTEYATITQSLPEKQMAQGLINNIRQQGTHKQQPYIYRFPQGI